MFFLGSNISVVGVKRLPLRIKVSLLHWKDTKNCHPSVNYLQIQIIWPTYRQVTHLLTYVYILIYVLFLRLSDWCTTKVLPHFSSVIHRFTYWECDSRGLVVTGGTVIIHKTLVVHSGSRIQVKRVDILPSFESTLSPPSCCLLRLLHKSCHSSCDLFFCLLSFIHD